MVGEHGGVQQGGLERRHSKRKQRDLEINPEVTLSGTRPIV